MARSVQLLHLTDPHLLADANARLHGWHVERAFTTVLEAAIDRYPDYDALVLGGDLVDDESVAGYRRLNTQLRRLERPVLAMAGNHDDPHRMARHLECAHVHTALTVGGWQLHALDSHLDGSEAGALGDSQLAGFEQRLATSEQPAVVFVHHPPVSVGSAWIDAIGLTDGDALAALLGRHPRLRAVVCGHAHQAHQFSIHGVAGWTTPATMRQFQPGAARFAEDTDRAPGYRWLSLAADGGIHSRVHRVKSARRACG